MVMELHQHLRNPWGILHGGATATLVDSAAVNAAGGRGFLSSDVVLHFLSPARVGPVIGHGQVLGDRPDGRLVRVDVHDEGAGGRLVAMAVVTVREA
jgi:uncharacterized protein (TIGR00369 family)